MNLTHHLVVAERLRLRLGWDERSRGQMLLGAIAPDAHTETAGLDRTGFHTEPGEDVIAAVVEMVWPEGCIASRAGRAFAVSCVGHLVADEMTRPSRYHLPPHAPSGFASLPPEHRAPLHCTFDAQSVRRALMHATVRCWLGALPPEAIDGKRWEVLGRFPLTEPDEPVAVVEPLATIAGRCADETVRRLYASDEGRRLVAALGG